MLRLGFPPFPQLVDDRQAALVEARVARHPPPTLARRGPVELFAPGLRLFLHPRQPAQLLQAFANAVANQPQIVDVLHGIVDLPLRERTLPPVGAGLVLLRRLAQELCNERAVAGRVLDAGQSGGKLDVRRGSSANERRPGGKTPFRLGPHARSSRGRPPPPPARRAGRCGRRSRQSSPDVAAC